MEPGLHTLEALPGVLGIIGFGFIGFAFATALLFAFPFCIIWTAGWMIGKEGIICDGPLPASAASLAPSFSLAPVLSHASAKAADGCVSSPACTASPSSPSPSTAQAYYVVTK